MGWLANLFKSPRRAQGPSHSTGFHDLDGDPVPMKPTAVELRAARELINAVAMQTVQAYGIPARWLTFEVVTIADEEKAYFQLQVMTHHWDEYLAAHCYAFERTVVKHIDEANTDVGRALRAVLWHMSPDAGCPYDALPEAQAWSADAVKKRGVVRDRIHREMYANSHSGAGAIAHALMSGIADEAERADRITMPSKYDSLLDGDDFGETGSSQFNGFAATQPFMPLAPGINGHSNQQAGGSAIALKYGSLLDAEAFSESRTSQFDGFAATEPFMPLMSGIIESPKNKP